MLIVMAGLPRSGNTLLANILAQNPAFRVAGTSGLVDILLVVRNEWDRIDEFRAMPSELSEAAKGRVLRAMLHAYHGEPAGKLVIDRSRTWLAHLEMLEYLLGRRVKVIAPIRDVRDVLASFELLWRRTSRTRQIPAEARGYFAYQTVPGRMGAWMAADGTVGLAYGRLRDAYQRGLGDRILLVPYDRLCSDPEGMVGDVYRFLERPRFGHHWKGMANTIEENDEIWAMPGLHHLRENLERSATDWHAVLGDAAASYGVLNDFFTEILERGQI